MNYLISHNIYSKSRRTMKHTKHGLRGVGVHFGFVIFVIINMLFLLDGTKLRSLCARVKENKSVVGNEFNICDCCRS